MQTYVLTVFLVGLLCLLAVMYIYDAVMVGTFSPRQISFGTATSIFSLFYACKNVSALSPKSECAMMTSSVTLWKGHDGGSMLANVNILAS